MANKPANAAQKNLMKEISTYINDAGLGVLYGDEYEGRTDFELHHVLGRSAKHNKVAIGHWFIIPVPFELHNVSSDHSDNVTHFKHNFTERFGTQRGIFSSLMCRLESIGKGGLVPLHVACEIMDTRA